MRTLPLLVGALALVLCPPQAARAGDVEALEKLLAEARLSLTEAVDAGGKGCGEGFPFHAELESDKGRAVFSIDVAQGTKNCNAIVDAKDGTIVEKDVEDEDHSAAVKASKVALKAAIATALGHRAGKAVEAQLSLATGKPVITVRIVAGGALVEVAVDGVTGAVLPAEPAGAEAPRPSDGFTDRFQVEPTEWTSKGTNPWFSLQPGHVLVLEGNDEGDATRITITVLAETKTVDGVETRVVEEREEKNGALAEVSRNYFALSKRTNDVYYFGEDVDIYEGGKVVRHDGAWLSGVNGAHFGLMMPGTPLLGARHYQEVAPGVAMDRAEIVSLDEKVGTPADVFSGCVRVVETTPLEPDKGLKCYARGVGLVRDGPLLLVKRTAPK